MNGDANQGDARLIQPIGQPENQNGVVGATSTIT